MQKGGTAFHLSTDGEAHYIGVLEYITEAYSSILMGPGGYQWLDIHKLLPRSLLNTPWQYFNEG